MNLRTLRTGLWHLRKGGPKQFKLWRQRRAIAARNEAVAQLKASAAQSRNDPPAAPQIPAWPVPKREPARPGLRIGLIADTFSAGAWRFECETLEVTPDEWRAELASHPIDVLFVESAWAGSGGAWRYQLTGSKAPTESLSELVAHCKERGIPTVFWNKEDPPHFEDFLDTARLFDHVFTSDENLLPAYREALGHDRVATLAFAAQPALHNPIRQRGLHQSLDIGFGGSYWSHKYPERQAQMELLLGAAAEVSTRRGIGFDIYSRFESDPKYRFPERFRPFVRGSLEYDQMLTAYRLHKVMLNVNSVVKSPTMLARRVFEVLASGTPVVTTRSAAIERAFAPGEITIVDTEVEAEDCLRALIASPELRDREVHMAQRRIWSEHTFSHRLNQVLDAAGIDDPAAPRQPRVSVLAPTVRPALVSDIIDKVGAQVGVDTQLVLLLHGFEADEVELRARAKRAGIADIVVMTAGREASLGTNLNRMVAAADGDFLAKMDDDDIYGVHYLQDLCFALGYSRASLIGKAARYWYLAASDATVVYQPHEEHRFTPLVGGPTMLGPRETWLAHPFEDRTRGEDTAFQRSITASGGSIYAADRFNFLQIRESSAEHTWNYADSEVLARSVVHSFGRADAHVMF